MLWAITAGELRLRLGSEVSSGPALVPPPVVVRLPVLMVAWLV